MGNKIKLRTAPPLDLASVDVYHVVFPLTSVAAGSSPRLLDGVFAIDLTPPDTSLVGTFTGFAALSNTVTGKKLRISLDSSNLGASAFALIQGTAFSGATIETVVFASSGSQITSEFWLTITSIYISVDLADPNLPGGSIEVREAVSITRTENGGTYAELTDYSNGVFAFNVANTLFQFELSPGYYFVDYPLDIHIPMRGKGDLIIGADLNGNNPFDGAIERPTMFGVELTDVRRGETLIGTSMTSLDGSSVPPAPNQNTTLSLDLDSRIKNLAPARRVFDERFKLSARSVNPNFGEALAIERRPLVLDNGRELVSGITGTIEFFLSPALDVDEYIGPERYILDITSATTAEVTSTTSTVLFLQEKASKVNRIYLRSDTERVPFAGQLQADGKTILMRDTLPANHSAVVVDYIPIDFNGDRISLSVDETGALRYRVKSNVSELQIFRHISWKRNTWHRIMLSWNAGSRTGIDYIRMFVDGTDDDAEVWGGGMVWGDGSLWGQTRAIEGGTFKRGRIGKLDEFSRIIFGDSYSFGGVWPMRIDNLRFSSVVRQPTIIGTSAFDLVWNENTDRILPVVEDANTKAIFDFNASTVTTEETANLLAAASPLFTVGVEIDDAFLKLVENVKSKTLLQDIYARARPAHVKIYTKYKQDE